MSNKTLDLALQNSPFNSSANKLGKQILFFPLFFFVIFLSAVLWLSDGDINTHSYWKTQSEWFIEFNSFLSSWPIFWANMTELGDALILFPLLSFLIFFHPKMWASLFGAIPLGALLSIGGKNLFAVPRPAAVLDSGLFEVIGHALKGHNSLPSGHTITVFACMTVVLFILVPSPRGLKQYSFLVIGFVVAGLIALSRVAVGAHWPLDILAGALCGTLAGISGIMLTQHYQRWWCWLKVEKYRFISGLIMFFWSISLIGVAYNDSCNSTIIVLVSAVFGLITSLHLLDRYRELFTKNMVLKKVASFSK